MAKNGKFGWFNQEKQVDHELGFWLLKLGTRGCYKKFTRQNPGGWEKKFSNLKEAHMMLRQHEPKFEVMWKRRRNN